MYKITTLRKVREQRVLHEAMLELTYNCNLDCFYCYNDRGKPGQPLSLDQYRALLEDLARMQTLFLTFTGGEPMVHPHFFELGGIARELGFVVRVRTNGHTLGAKQCARLKHEVDPYMVEISLHGATAATHDKQTRVAGSFERLVRNIGHAQQAGLRLSAVCTPTAWNEHEIDAMLALCDGIGLPLRFQGPLAPRDNGDLAPLVIQPREDTWRLIEQRMGERNDRPVLECEPEDGQEAERAMCGVGVSGVDIDPYGNVQACMHLQESAGNLHEQSIEDIWLNSPLFGRARARSVAAAAAVGEDGPRQLGAPVFCIAVEENLAKGNAGGCGACQGGCG